MSEEEQKQPEIERQAGYLEEVIDYLDNLTSEKRMVDTQQLKELLQADLGIENEGEAMPFNLNSVLEASKVNIDEKNRPTSIPLKEGKLLINLPFPLEAVDLIRIAYEIDKRTDRRLTRFWHTREEEVVTNLQGFLLILFGSQKQNLGPQIFADERFNGLLKVVYEDTRKHLILKNFNGVLGTEPGKN